MITRGNMSRKSTVVTALCTLIGCAWVLPVENARILAIETIAGKSHWNFMSAVLRALTDNGHNVTVFTPFVDGNRENYTEVDTSSIFPIIVNMELTYIREINANQFKSIRFMMHTFRSFCDVLYKNDKLNEILANNMIADFDVIIIEPSMMSGCMTYGATKSTLPLIFTMPLPANTFTERDTTGHFPNPAITSSFTSDHAFPKTFAQRFFNTIVFLYSQTIVAFEEYLLKTFDPKFFDINTPVSPSLVFINNHFISDVPRPVTPNVVRVGGIHLRPPKNIPTDILEFIENSPQGVILLTFGSTIAMSSMPKNIQKIFLEVLAQLPQRVLLKYEGELEDKPANVMIKQWLPQRDILMHENVKLFISHGGISGVYEAVDAGVPVLGFPLFGDQARNIDGLVEAGMAISMEVFSVSKETFSKNIIDLINNKKYTRNAKIASSIFKDRPMSPAESVVYWTEYVIRHKGAPHLKSHALNLAWYQYILLDVIVVIFIILFAFYRMFKFAFKYIIRTVKYFYIPKIKFE